MPTHLHLGYSDSEHSTPLKIILFCTMAFGIRQTPPLILLPASFPHPQCWLLGYDIICASSPAVELVSGMPAL
eukprot:scaffold5571_cov78-Skeletonema_dohrnii-CCMP3373.AAC.2